MWVLITNIFTNAALLVPVIGFIIVFISARDERIRSLTTMKIEVEDFYKKYSYIQSQVEPAPEYRIEEINKIKDDIKLNEQEGRDKLKMFIIFLFIYLLFIMGLEN